jgi:hypothetical protein
MNSTQTCENSLLPIAPQRVGNDIGIFPAKNTLSFLDSPDAHTIAASRRLAPLKKMIFTEINQPKSKSTLSPTPYPKSTLIKPNQT